MKKLIWLIIIIAATYYGYNNWLPAANDSEVINNEIEEVATEPTAWVTHKNDSYANYSIQYYSDWNVTDSTEQTIFTSPDELDNVVISLRKTNTSNNNKIQTIKEIAGQQVLIIEGEDPDDGSPAKFIIFNLSNNEKLEVRGFGSIFDKMVDTLVLNSEQPQINDNANDTNSDSNDTNEENAKELIDNKTQEEKITEEQKETPPLEPEEIVVKTEDEELIIKIFYQKDPGDNCSAVTGVVKDIDTRYNTDEVNTLVTLTRGLSSEESNQGYTTAIPYGTRLRNLDIRSGVATADFNSTLNEGGGSCEMAARRAQITATLMQFPDIEQVIITVDGL